MKAKKQSLFERLRKRSKLGFSLVELIVVIAIMAVLVAVLAPALLSYVERSRAQKDESAMGEVTNAVLLAMSDADVYDELLVHSITDNVSCYIDNADESEVSDYITVTKAATKKIATQYTFGDDARLADETPYHAAGNMRGVTITFKPATSTNTSTYVLAEGVINKFDEDATETVVLEDCEHLYNAVRATIGNEVKSTSQTYRNSEYTIFIKIGSLGGSQAEAQDAIQVYGQYNGTNLALSEDEVGRATATTIKDGNEVQDPTPGGNLNESAPIVGCATLNDRSTIWSWEKLRSQYGITDEIIPDAALEDECFIDFSINSGIKTIGNRAFFNNSELESIAIPSSVTTIGFDAFTYCISLTSITYNGTKEQWDAIEKEDVWNGYCPEINLTCADGTFTIPAGPDV